jgi:hypothetical protein
VAGNPSLDPRGIRVVDLRDLPWNFGPAALRPADAGLVKPRSAWLETDTGYGFYSDGFEWLQLFPTGAGKIFYLAPSDSSDIAGYDTLLQVPSAGAEQTIATVCTGTGDVLIEEFATDPGVPGAVDFPAGTAARRIYARVTNGTARLHLKVYVRDGAGVERLVRDEFSPDFSNTAVALQEWLVSPPSGGSLLATDRLVAKLYAQRVSGPTTITVTTHYEGATPSQIQTTIIGGGGGGTGAAAARQFGAGWTGPYPLNILTGAVWKVPRIDGAAMTFDLTRMLFRLESPGTTTTTVRVEKSAGGGVFSATPTTVGTLTLTAGSYETSTASGLGTVTSGDLLRIVWVAVGTNARGYLVQIEGAE